MSKYPDSWEMKKLGNLCKRITKGTTPRNYSSKGVKFIKLESITEENILQIEKFASISIRTNEELKRSQLQEGDILFSIAGSLGKVAEVNESHLPANTNQALAILRLENNSIDRSYFKYQLTSPFIKERIHKFGTIGAQPNLSLQQVSDFEIPVPPRSEQNKIAEILSGIDNLILKKIELNTKNDLLLKALIEDLMGGDDHWQRVLLSEILLFKNGLNTSKENFGVGVPFVSYKNVYAGGLINAEDLSEFVSLKPSEQDGFCLKRGDILFTRTSETPDEIGFNAVYNASIPAVFNGFCIRGRPLNDSLLIPEFSSFCFSSNAILSQMRSLCKYTTRAGISAESLGKVEIMIPPLNVQKNIINTLSSLKQLISAVDQSINSLKNLKQSISQDLLLCHKRVNI